MDGGSAPAVVQEQVARDISHRSERLMYKKKSAKRHAEVDQKRTMDGTDDVPNAVDLSVVK